MNISALLKAGTSKCICHLRTKKYLKRADSAVNISNIYSGATINQGCWPIYMPEHALPQISMGKIYYFTKDIINVGGTERPFAGQRWFGFSEHPITD